MQTKKIKWKSYKTMKTKTHELKKKQTMNLEFKIHEQHT